MAANQTTIIANNAQYRQISSHRRLAIFVYVLSNWCDGVTATTYANNPNTLLKDARNATGSMDRDPAVFESAIIGLTIFGSNAGNISGGANPATSTNLNTLMAKSAVLAGATDAVLKQCVAYLWAKMAGV